MLFKKPVKVNEHIRIYGRVDRVGTTSIALCLEARRFNFNNHSEETVCSTRAIFVRIDPNGQPVDIDPDIRKKYNHLNLNA